MKESDQITPNAMDFNDFEEHYAEINGINIYYEYKNIEDEENGKKKNWDKDTAVLLVHGWTANRFRIHPLYLNFWKNHIPVFRLDLRGHGWSQKDEDLDYSLPAFIDDIHVFIQKVILKKFGFKKIMLIGHSMGGLIVQGVITEYDPDYIEKVILISTSPYFFDNLIRKIGAYLEIRSYKKDFWKKYNKKKEGEKSIGLEHFPQWFEKYNTEGRTLYPSQNATIKSIEEMKMFDLRDKIQKMDFKKPTLIMTGKKDILAHPRFSKWMGEQFENSEVHIIPKGEHNIDLHKPLTVRKIVNDFLNI